MLSVLKFFFAKRAQQAWLQSSKRSDIVAGSNLGDKHAVDKRTCWLGYDVGGQLVFDWMTETFVGVGEEPEAVAVVFAQVSNLVSAHAHVTSQHFVISTQYLFCKPETFVVKQLRKYLVVLGGSVASLRQAGLTSSFLSMTH